ncbi:MAG: caspase family protein [Bacteroidales bacterium]|nr:MAG: caspase family protein [Bacteroidales bacterium]
MKKLNYFMVRLLILICIQSFCFIISAQEQKQIVGTSDGKYGIITINKGLQQQDTVNLHLSVQWIDENLKPVEDNSSVVILDKNNIKISQQEYIEWDNFTAKDFVYFNKSVDLKFKIDDEIERDEIDVSLDFGFLDMSRLSDYNEKDAFLLKQPQNITVNYEINRDLFVKVIPTPPTIKIISPVLDDENKAYTPKSDIEISINASDENGINLVTVNSKDAVALPGGIYKSKLRLSPGINKVYVMAVDNDGSLTEEEITIHCSDYSIAADMLLKGGKYYGLFIAIENYQDNKINDLDNAVDDAKELYETLLANYTFEEKNMKMLVDPKREDIVIALDELSNTVTDKDNLLIFYAGHGHWEEKTSIGYWLPTDAKRSNTANWFRNSTLRDYISSINSNHTLLIADACFTGSIFKTRRAFANSSIAIEKLYNLPSRKAMTSGTLEEVPDRSVFVEYLIKRLKDNPEIYLSSETLFTSFRTAVMNNSPNLPQYGEINNTGDEGGDFIFIRKKAAEEN